MEWLKRGYMIMAYTSKHTLGLILGSIPVQASALECLDTYIDWILV